MRALRGAGIGVVLGSALAAAALAGCSSSPSSSPTGSTGSAAESMTDRAAGLLFGSSSAPPPARAAAPGAATFSAADCPGIDVRQGASTFIVYGKGEQAPTNVRYQATVAQTARECNFQPASITMRVGMQGRIILGPMGGPGRIDLPIRFALVQEGAEPKTIWTKLYKTSVDIPAGEGNVAFTHIENNLTFPNPGASALEAYVLYLGFDNGPAKPGRGGAAAATPGVDLPPEKPQRRGRRARRANPS